MSQSKTFIPGIDDAPNGGGAAGDLYGRSAGASDRTRTYVPGIYRDASQEGCEPQSPQPETTMRIQGRTMVGMLYSISHIATGEVFPIYIGRNTIGSSDDSDVCLLEQTVSPHHAVLLVRAIDTAEGGHTLTMHITDYDSEYGTIVGNDRLEYDKVECRDHDVITIGRSYKLLLCLFDADGYGLKVADDFMPIERQRRDNGKAMAASTDYLRPSAEAQPFIPATIGAADETAFYGRTKKQEGDHSTNKTVLL